MLRESAATSIDSDVIPHIVTQQAHVLCWRTLAAADTWIEFGHKRKQYREVREHCINNEWQCFVLFLRY